MSSSVSIEIKNGSLEIPIYGSGSLSLKNEILGLGSKFSRNEGSYSVTALVDLNFNAYSGDRIGLIGSNGAGKTTLLKVIAGIYFLSSGTIGVKGKIVPLLDLSFGMDENSSGIDNIRLRGLFLGMTSDEITCKTEEIVRFAGIGDYIKLPLRVYSAGMKMRLAFAVSTVVNADILLLDEILGVGDDRFQKQAVGRVQEMRERSGVVVMANHSLDTIRDNCNKVLWLNSGEVVLYGDADYVLNRYANRV
jgi:ABC-type polysaccharide/polyol phosphate transport system ATPase subunit